MFANISGRQNIVAGRADSISAYSTEQIYKACISLCLLFMFLSSAELPPKTASQCCFVHLGVIKLSILNLLTDLKTLYFYIHKVTYVTFTSDYLSTLSLF